LADLLSVGEKPDVAAREAATSYDELCEIAAACRGFQVRRLRKWTPHLQVAVNEATAVGLPYLISRSKKESPMIRARAGSSVYAVLKDEFENLWGKAEVPKPL
jgi:hypothetical protein